MVKVKLHLLSFCYGPSQSLWSMEVLYPHLRLDSGIFTMVPCLWVVASWVFFVRGPKIRNDLYCPLDDITL